MPPQWLAIKNCNNNKESSDHEEIADEELQAQRCVMFTKNQ